MPMRYQYRKISLNLKAVNSICIFLSSTNWNRVYAVKMFADIICPKGSDQEEDITKTCPKLWQVMMIAHPDFMIRVVFF